MKYAKFIKFSGVLFVLLLVPVSLWALEFDYSEGAVYRYQISINLTQDNIFISTDNVAADSGQLTLKSDFLLCLTIRVLENVEGDYARISCTYDSLSGRIASTDGEIPEAINIKVLRDSIEIRLAESLVAVYPPQSEADQTVRDYYERLLFIGEPIELTVYPTGEIININTNKNLWQQAHDFIGLNGEGILNIKLPDNSDNNRWVQSIDIQSLGMIKLKKAVDPLELTFTNNPGAQRIEFAGLLEINNYITPATIMDLNDEFRISINNTVLSRNGSAAYHGRKIIIDKLEFKTALTGDITLNGENNTSYQTALKLNNINSIKYELIGSN